MTSDTHYSLSTVTTLGPRAATVEFTDDVSGPLPASGVLPADFYTLRANASALALAQDANGAESVSAGPFQASAEVTFAAVGSPTLVLGTVSAGGTGAGGLVVDALVGESIVASATTGDDGSYLLPGLPGSVTLRISDPTGVLPTQQSGPLTPPATFDVDVPAAVPSVSAPLGVALVLGLLTAGLLGSRSRARER